MLPTDAIDDFIALPQDQQMAMLQKLPRANQDALLAKVKERTAKPPTPTPDWRDKFTEIQKPDSANKWSPREAVKAVGNIGAGGLGMILHPIDTFAGFGGLMTAPGEMAAGTPFKETVPGQIWESLKTNPYGTVEAGVGQAGAAEMLPPVLRGGSEILRKGTGGVVEAVTKTGPGVTRELVKDVAANRDTVAKEAAQIETKDATEAARQKHADEVAANKHATDSQAALDKAKAEHEAAQKEYFRKEAEHKAGTAKTEAANATLNKAHDEAKQAHAKLQSSLNESERTAKVDLKKVEERVHDEADQLYKELKPQLQDEDADPETVSSIVDHGLDTHDPSLPKPAILEKLEKVAKARALTYGDLDQFRSSIGRELRKGTLPGSTFKLYETMLEGDPENGIAGIADEMERIAKEQGLQEQAAQARAAWREWAEAFRDRASPLRSILKDPEAHGLLREMRGQQSFLARLRAFGPDGTALAEQIEKGLATAHDAKAQFTKYGTIEVPAPKPPTLGEVKPFTENAPEFKAPQGKPAPKPSQPLLTSGSAAERAQATDGKHTTVDAEDIRAAKTKSLAAKEHHARTGYSPLLTTVSVFDAMRNAIEGNWSRVGVDIAARGGYEVGKQAFAALLRNPKVIDILTKPTARDIAQVPPEMRGQIGEFAKQAQKQGIKVDPRLLALVGITSAPRPTTGPLSQSPLP